MKLWFQYTLYDEINKSWELREFIQFIHLIFKQSQIKLKFICIRTGNIFLVSNDFDKEILSDILNIGAIRKLQKQKHLDVENKKLKKGSPVSVP